MSKLARLQLDKAICGFLIECPLHGYDLDAQFQKELGRIWQAGRSQIYAILHRLEERGWVNSSVEEQDNRPPRTVYQITQAGQQAFDGWLRSPVVHLRDMRVEFLAKLYFHRLLGRDAALLLAAQAALIRERLDKLSERAAEEEAYADRLTTNFRAAQMTALLHWVEGVETT